MVLALTGLWAAACSSAVAQTVYPPPQPSAWQSFSSSVKQAFTPTPAPPSTSDDPVSLKSKGKPGIDLYVAVARMFEEAGKFAEAEEKYKRALQEAPNDTRPLLGYARLKDRLGEAQEALRLYQRAAKANPHEPVVFNHLAIHFARRGMLREAIGAEDRAIHLRPTEPRYRNNMAMLLVEAGRPQEAYLQLHAVYDDAVAHYNLGFLLNKKGQPQAAAQEFIVALRLNPSLAQARQWLDRLAAGAMPASRPADYGPTPPEEPRMASNPQPPGIDAPSRGPLPPAWPAPDANSIRILPSPPPSAGVASTGTPPREGTVSQDPPDSGTGGLQRLPPIANPLPAARQPVESDDPDSAPPYLPRTR